MNGVLPRVHRGSRDRSIFAIEPEQLVMLQREGLGEPVILAMLKSGREPQPIVIVGHGPDTSNAPQYTARPFRYRTPSLGARRVVEPRALCDAQISTPRSGPSQSLITECPAVMQPRRR